MSHLRMGPSMSMLRGHFRCMLKFMIGRDRSMEKTRSDADSCTLAMQVKEVHKPTYTYAGPDPGLSACLNTYPVESYAFLHYQIKAHVRTLGFNWLIET